MDPIADALIATLRRNPNDATAYANLRAHYHQRGDYASLTNLVEGYAQQATDAQVAAASYFDAAELAWGALGDAHRGAALYERVLERVPLHDDAFARLLALYEEAGDSHRLSSLYERRADALARAGADARAVAEVHHRLGELWQHMFHRSDRAIVHFRKAFELDPTLVPAIYAARDLYQQAGNTKAAAALLELEARSEADEERRIALLRELANLRNEELGDPEGAVVALKRALGFAPGHPALLEDLANVYMARAARQPDPHVADSDRRRAADVFVQLSQRKPPADAVPLLGRALDIVPDHEPALALLERIAEHVGHFELLPARWVAFLSRAPDAPGAGDRRRRLAKAYLDAGQVDYAIACLEWLSADGDLEATERLLELHTRAGRHDEALRIVLRAGNALPAPLRANHLRRALQTASLRGEDAEVTRLARELIAADPADSEALAVLEGLHRRRGEWRELRDVLAASLQNPELPTDTRRVRLKEIAQIAERRLADADAAVVALRQLATIDPSDREARTALARLYEQAGRWDDLAEILERDALATSDESAKVEAYRALALLHADRRRDPREAALAWRSLLDLRPGDSEAHERWIQALLASDALSEAVPALRERARLASTPEPRCAANRLLAQTLEKLADPTNTRDPRWSEAIDAWTRVIDDAPRDAEALDRLEAIAEKQCDWERLLRALAYRSDVEEGAGKVAVLLRMAGTAERNLRDLTRAADLYHRAFELDGRNDVVLDHLVRVYEAAERYRDLVTLLRERARTESSAEVRAGLFKRIARVLHERVQNDSAAADAYRRVLDDQEDPEALRFLLRLSEHKQQHDDSVVLLERLANTATSRDERRDLLVQRADVLAGPLARPRDAYDALRVVAETVDSRHLPTLGRLGDLAETLGAPLDLADALERTLNVVEEPRVRASIAERLVQLCTGELADGRRAMRAAEEWRRAEGGSAAPLRALVPLYEQDARWPALVEVLVALAPLEVDRETTNALLRRAADLLATRLNRPDEALGYLEQAARSGDALALEQLWALAREARRGDRVVAFFSTDAEESPVPSDQKRSYLEAARASESLLGDVARAFELTLKALAIDLADTTVLDQADRLAAASRSFPRLGQVYETLLRKADSREAKLELLLRQAAVLERDDAEPGAAFDRYLRAAAIAPFDARVMGALEQLAPRLGRGEDLLVVYERRKKDATADEARVDELLASSRVSLRLLDEHERSMTYVAAAVALAVRTPTLFARIEAGAADIDPGLGRALVDVYATLADDLDADPRAAAGLLVRAAGILRLPPKDDAQAYGALLRATTLAPFDEPTLDALEALAFEIGRVDSLVEHLARLLEEAVESRTAVLLSRRRASLLEKLEQYESAAEAWTRVRQLAPQDVEARARVRACLRKARKFEDLLLALQADLRVLKEPAQQLALRKETARTWEFDLHNRWESIEAWQKVQKLDEADADAVAALDRLRKVDVPVGADASQRGLEAEPEQAHVFELDSGSSSHGEPTTAEVVTPEALHASLDRVEPAPGGEPAEGTGEAPELDSIDQFLAESREPSASVRPGPEAPTAGVAELVDAEDDLEEEDFEDLSGSSLRWDPPAAPAVDAVPPRVAAYEPSSAENDFAALDAVAEESILRRCVARVEESLDVPDLASDEDLAVEDELDLEMLAPPSLPTNLGLPPRPVTKPSLPPRPPSGPSVPPPPPGRKPS